MITSCSFADGDGSFLVKNIQSSPRTTDHIVKYELEGKLHVSSIRIEKELFDKNDFLINADISQFELFSDLDLRGAIEQKIEHFRNKEPSGSYDVTYPLSGGVAVTIKSSDSHGMMNEFQGFVKNESDAILHQKYHVNPGYGKIRSTFDYRFAVNSQLMEISVLSKALIGSIAGKSDFDKLSFLLNYTQSIAYSTDGRPILKTPLAVLNSGTGDCDDKSVLFSSLVKSSISHINLVLLVLDTSFGHHAIILIEWNHPHSNLIAINEKSYIPVETTGNFKIGTLPEEVWKAIKLGKHRAVEL